MLKKARRYVKPFPFVNNHGVTRTDTQTDGRTELLYQILGDNPAGDNQLSEN